MAEQHTMPAVAAINDQAQQLRRAALRISSDLTALDSLVTAFRLAAVADENGGAHALYWPDLMEMIEEKIPDRETYDGLFSGIVATLGDIAMTTQQAQSQAAEASPAARTARAPRSRRALADHAIA